MRIFLAYLFKLLFRITPFRKHYFGLYKKVFRPYQLFRGVRTICRYDKYFRIEADLDDWIQQQIFFFGVYDQPGINFLKRSLNPGDVFFDLGANIGIYSLTASRITGSDTGGTVYAFEPAGQVYEKLLKNISLNNIKNIHPQRLAVYEKKTVLELILSCRENLGMSSIFRHDHESGLTEKVEAVRLDDFIEEKGISKVDFIKIDIEGAELFALKGMNQTLEKHKPLLLVEISGNILEGKGISGSEVFDFLKEIGYAPHIIDEEGTITTLEGISMQAVTNYVFVHVQNLRILTL